MSHLFLIKYEGLLLYFFRSSKKSMDNMLPDIGDITHLPSSLVFTEDDRETFSELFDDGNECEEDICEVKRVEPGSDLSPYIGVLNMMESVE